MSTRHETVHPAASYTDRSTTTTGSSQEVAAANKHRLGFLIQNISDTDMYINFGATAAASAGSILLEANGGYWETPPHGVPTAAINLFCSAGAKDFTAKEW